MRDSLPEPPMPARLPSLYFEYGADEATCESGIEISERGMCFDSRWQFSPGTHVGIAVSFTDLQGDLQHVRAEAFVVDCAPAGPGCHQVTLLFLELEDQARPAIRDLSCLMGAQRRTSVRPRAWRR